MRAFVTEGSILVRDGSYILPTSCVTVRDRLSFKALGYLSKPGHIKRLGEFNCPLADLPCGHEDKIGAVQLFPIFSHPLLRTPTIKHPCPQVEFSTIIQACGLKIKPKGYQDWVDCKTNNLPVYDEWVDFFWKCWVPRFERYLERQVIDVDLDKWLDEGKFTKSYKTMIRQAFTNDKRTCKFSYEAFTKIEMQVTAVYHWLKDTKWNDVKERQICGPSAEKKAYNAFINQLEGIAHLHDKHYCGRKNWEEICHMIDVIRDNHPTWMCWKADLSRFDASQISFLWRKCNGESQKYLMMTYHLHEAMKRYAKHPNVIWHEPLTVEGFCQMLDQSLIIQASMARGHIKYFTQGRASGDGWTTFGNTHMVESYQAFVYRKAGSKDIDDDEWICKGDDGLGWLDPSMQPAWVAAKEYVFSDTKDGEGGIGVCERDLVFGDIDEMDFLSNFFFITDDNHVRMTRMPHRVIQTNSWSTSLAKIPEHQVADVRKQLVYSKGMCLLAWGTGLPIWEKLGQKMVTLGKKGPYSEFDQYADGPRTWQPRDDRKAYLRFLERKFGVTEAMVVQIEQQIDSVQSLEGELFSEFFDLFYC